MSVMSMSRQDFVAVAHVLRTQLDDASKHSTLSATRAVWQAAETLADVFASHYPAFDRERFLAAVRGN